MGLVSGYLNLPHLINTTIPGTSVKVLTVSMEAAVENNAHTYSGGLGVLVGDKIRAAQDMKKPVDVITFSYPEGYVRNRVVDGKIIAETNPYEPEKMFREWDTFTLKTGFGDVSIKILQGKNSWFIHTDLANRLYVEDGGEHRLKKEIIIGKVAEKLFLQEGFDVLHVEESQCAFAGLELKKASPKSRVVFTTHTPLPHGHETWDSEIVKKLYSPLGKLNMTKLALDSCDFVNCVSKMQRDIMNPFLQERAKFITNGVHKSWKHAGGKRKAKQELLKAVKNQAFHTKDFDDSFTIGIARRFTSYKRMDLVFSEFDKLEELAKHTPIQIVFAGVAHPSDTEGIKTIERVLETAATAKHVRIAYFPNYDMDLARKMIAGSDAWMNVPVEGQEASGTSWMKAMMNGTILISTVSGSVPEFADAGNALLIPPGSAKEQGLSLFNLIKRAAQEDTHEMSKAAIAVSDKVSAKRMMEEYFSRAYDV